LKVPRTALLARGKITYERSPKGDKIVTGVGWWGRTRTLLYQKAPPTSGGKRYDNGEVSKKLKVGKLEQGWGLISSHENRRGKSLIYANWRKRSENGSGVEDK